MRADGKRFNQRKLLSAQPFAINQPFNGHSDIFLKAAVALYTHRLIIVTGINQPSLAGVAFSAVKIRVTGDNVAHFEAFIVFGDFHYLRRKLMTGYAGIGGKRLVARIGGYVSAADAAVKDLQQRFALPALGFFLIHNADLKRVSNLYGFHASTSSIYCLFQMTAVFSGAPLQYILFR